MKVSIVTVTYNSESTLPRTLDSVLRQTHADIDYWVIDGGSTDGTLRIVADYERRFGGRMHWLSEPDAGIYDAMNKGLARCSGDVTGFLNSDDRFATANVVAAIAGSFSSGIDAVYGDVSYVSREQPDSPVYRRSGRLFRQALLRFGVAPPHPTFYARTPVLCRSGGFNARFHIAGDFDLMARLFLKDHIQARYTSGDAVVMTIGGTSTKDEQARRTGLEEMLCSCRQLGIRTSARLLRWQRFFSVLENHV